MKLSSTHVFPKKSTDNIGLILGNVRVLPHEQIRTYRQQHNGPS